MELVKEIRILVPKMDRIGSILLYVNVRIREINKLCHLIADTASFGNSLFRCFGQFNHIHVHSLIYRSTIFTIFIYLFTYFWLG